MPVADQLHSMHSLKRVLLRETFQYFFARMSAGSVTARGADARMLARGMRKADAKSFRLALDVAPALAFAMHHEMAEFVGTVVPAPFWRCHRVQEHERRALSPERERVQFSIVLRQREHAHAVVLKQVNDVWDRRRAELPGRARSIGREFRIHPVAIRDVRILQLETGPNPSVQLQRDAAGTESAVALPCCHCLVRAKARCLRGQQLDFWRAEERRRKVEHAGQHPDLLVVRRRLASFVPADRLRRERRKLGDLDLASSRGDAEQASGEKA